MLGLVVCQPSEMVNHFFPAPPSPPAKSPDRDKLNDDWLGSSSLGDRPTMQPRPCARNHIQPRPSTRSNKPYGLSRPCCLIMTLTVNLLVILAWVSTAEAIRSEPETANPSLCSNYAYCCMTAIRWNKFSIFFLTFCLNFIYHFCCHI